MGELPLKDSERRYWLDQRHGYVRLADFPPLILALRKAGDPGWARRHPSEPTLEDRARRIAKARTGMPAYLVDDETWNAALAEAQNDTVEVSRNGGAR